MFFLFPFKCILNPVLVISVTDRASPLSGEAGLEQLMREGKLRLGRSDDMRAWEETKRRASGQPAINVVGSRPANESGSTSLRNTYVVLAPTRFPAGLYGAHSATFIVLRGVPVPEGNPGHSAVLDMNTANCKGVTCR